MEKNYKKIYLTYYNLLIAQDLWQAHYEILPIIFLKEFIELNINLDMMITKCEICGKTYNYCNCFLELTNIKDDVIEYKCANTTERFFKTYKFYFVVGKKCVSLGRYG